jgi:hypothetical protein
MYTYILLAVHQRASMKRVCAYKLLMRPVPVAQKRRATHVKTTWKIRLVVMDMKGIDLYFLISHCDKW